MSYLVLYLIVGWLLASLRYLHISAMRGMFVNITPPQYFSWIALWPLMALLLLPKKWFRK